MSKPPVAQALLPAAPRLVSALLFGACLFAEVKVDSATFGAIEARPIGPAVTSGRIAAIDGVASDPKTIYVGAAGGGVWKSVNGGTTFKPIFDKYTQSIGAIAVDQAHPSNVWVGTGEVWVRNSTSIGTGIYKTTDAGDNWKFMGLPNSERIGKIVVDPKNSDVVYVAVLGHLWDSNEDRGLYKTSDGGKTWQRILYVNPDTGCSDVAVDPQEPHVVYASMWQYRRYPWTFKSGGPGSGLYRSIDSGKTWEKIKTGLPEGDLGRIALALSPARSSTVYAVVESKKSALYRSDDLGKTWSQVNSDSAMGVRPFYFSLLVADPKDYNRVYKPGFVLGSSKDGGKTFSTLGAGINGSVHSDMHALWIDPVQPSTLYLGTDGGVYKSLDYGSSWSFLRSLPVGQFYHVTFDMQRPYNVYGGLQDNGSWAAPSQGRGAIENRDWLNVGIGDGFNAFADPNDANVVYAEYQNGRLLRYYRSTGEMKSIPPYPKPGEPKLRFNWNTPFLVSPNDSHVLYVGAQHVYRSRDRGESWERISGDLTTNDPEKQKQEQSGGITIDNSSAENHCTVYAIAESPMDAKVVWAGTDDGNLQITRDGGKTWKNVTANVKGVPKNTLVSSIEASRFQPGTAYVTFDGHQTGDMKTYIYKTSDFGATWTSIATDAVKSYAHIIREDRVKPDLLFAGTELGLFLTIDGGRQWAQFTGNLPNVAVRDLAIHPRESDLIIATHGRGVYIVDDITPIRQITPEVLDSTLKVLNPQPAPIRFSRVEQIFAGSDEFEGSNSPEVAYITYYLKDRHTFGDFKIQMFDSENHLISTLAGGTRRGINRVPWAMRLKPPKVPTAQSIEFRSVTGPMLPEGTYTAKILKGEETYMAEVKLVGDPSLPHSAEDRKLQQQTVMKLYNISERLAFVKAAVSDARDQAADRLKKLKPEDPLLKQVTALKSKLDGLEKEIIPTGDPGAMAQITGEVRLREDIGEIYGDVSLYAGRPTQSQIDRTEALAQRVEAVNHSYNEIAATFGTVNDSLKSQKLNPIRALTKEEFDKRESSGVRPGSPYFALSLW
jgi:photosystem II stability/assembly factor-like uncharacterized protein